MQKAQGRGLDVLYWSHFAAVQSLITVGHSFSMARTEHTQNRGQRNEQLESQNVAPRGAPEDVCTLWS